MFDSSIFIIKLGGFYKNQNFLKKI